MFKLPLLQPSLTGQNGIERSNSRNGSGIFVPFVGPSRSVKDAEPPPGIEVKGWSAQARDITADMVASDKYKSLALHAEVKLAEALERCERVSPACYTAQGEQKPSKLRVAVGCQLLGEFAELCGPFTPVLRSIRDELVKGIYSWFYESERGLLTFDQMPWFAVAERLEREKDAMVEEQERFAQQLRQQQTLMSRVEEQLSLYQRSMEAAQAEAEGLRLKLEELTVSEEAARIESKTGREELKRLRKEALAHKDEMETEKAQSKKLKEIAQNATMALREQYNELIGQVQSAQAEAAQARQVASERLPPEIIANIRTQLEHSIAELAAAKAQIAELEAGREKLQTKLGQMTPKPTWKHLRKHGLDEAKHTQDTVARVVDRMTTYYHELAAAKREAAFHAALTAPDPAPREVHLDISVDSSAYFITEGGGSGQGTGSTAGGANGSPAPPAKVHVQPLGTAPDVPRCLRWTGEKGEKLQLTVMTREEAEVLVASIWRAKHAFSRDHSALCLQSFLFHYFSAGATSPEEVARSSYSLYHACASHAASSPLVDSFCKVLTGQLSEEVLRDQTAMVSGLAAALSSLPAVGGGGSSDAAGAESLDAAAARRASSSVASTSGGSSEFVQVQAVQELLERAFGHRKPYQLAKLNAALASQLRRHRGGRGSGGGGGGGTAPDGAVPLTALLQALQPCMLQAPAPAGAAAGAANGDQQPSVGGPLLDVLLLQHLEEVEACCADVASQLLALLPETSQLAPAATPTSSAAGHGAGVEQEGQSQGTEEGAEPSTVPGQGIGESGSEEGSRESAAAASKPAHSSAFVPAGRVADALGAAGVAREDAVRCLAAAAGTSRCCGFDVQHETAVLGFVPLSAQYVEHLTRRVCLLRPGPSIDMASALAWVAKGVGGLAGSSSTGRQPLPV